MNYTPGSILSRFHSPLLLGMGGGYDLFAGLPTYFDFLEEGKNPIFANLSFTRELAKKCSFSIDEPYTFFKVLAAEFQNDAFDETLGFPANYFPEYHLSNWFRKKQDISLPIYAIQLIDDLKTSGPLGVQNYFEAIDAIVRTCECDAIILVDAGVDSLVIGDEEGLGTYAEDFLTLLASIKSDLPVYLQCIGLGTEAGIAIDDFLVNLSIHRKNDAYLGCFDWMKSDFGVSLYLDAVASCIPENSSIHSLLSAAIAGKYGAICPTPLKKRGLDDGEVLIHPMMTLAFWFDARRIMSGRMFVDECSAALSLRDLDLRFDEARRRIGLIDSEGVYRGKRPFSRSLDSILLDRFTRGVYELD